MTDWTPILSESTDLAARAREAMGAISQAVLTAEYPPALQRRRHRFYEESLLYGYLGLVSDDPQWIEHATLRLNGEIERAPELRQHLSLYGGLCGLGWVIEHLSRALAEEPAPPENGVPPAAADEPGDVNADIDALVLFDLRQRPWIVYDLISGLVGVGIYFLERLPRNTAKKGIRAVIDGIERLSESADPGIAWFTGPELLPDWQRTLCPGGYYNLGVAHGIPGILFFLSEAIAAGVEEPRAGRLLEGGMRWLMAQQRAAGSLARFSSWLPSSESRGARLAWCYGDLGILAVALQVARRAGRQDWSDFAHALLDNCLSWPAEQAGAIDAPLCHGAVGIAHIFNRIYQSEGDVRCREAALKWYQTALDMRRPGEGVGGFLVAAKPDPSGPTVWEASPNFLDGSIGIALALLSALEPIAPDWDRLLLLSGRDWRAADRAEGPRTGDAI